MTDLRPHRWSPLVRGPAGFPFHPVLAALALGAWACSLGFDLLSQVADAAWVYERGAYVLVGGGLVLAVVAGLVGLLDLRELDRGTSAFRTGIRHLLVMDVALVLFTGSFLIRRRSDFTWHEGVAVPAMVLSLLGLVAVGAGTWLGSQLAFGYGVRVERDRSPT